MEVTLEQVADRLAEMSNQLAGLAQASAELKEQARSYRDELKEQARTYHDELTEQARTYNGELKEQASTYKDELKEQASTYTHELKEQTLLYREDLKDDVKKAAEGFGATLESIERRMERLELKVDQGFDDTRLLLKDHERRITSLENR